MNSMEQDILHTKKLEELYSELMSSSEGITHDEALSRLETYGPNRVQTIHHRSFFEIVFGQLKNIFTVVLLVAALGVWFLGETIDASVIGFVILINVIIGAVQEYKAEKTLIKLEQNLRGHVRVKRKGTITVVKEHALVPGDIIILQGGDSVYADARLISSNGLEVDEASLSGESTFVKKDAHARHGKDTPLTDQTNMIFRGTHVMAGFAEALVVRTGVHSVVGSMTKDLQEIDLSDIPLRASLRKVSWHILILIGFGLLVTAFAGWRADLDTAEIIGTLIALAVSAVPESLPVILTVILAVGVWRMSVHNTLVKDLYAVEALGQATVMALDKTGTITRNEMMVTNIVTFQKKYKVYGSGYQPLGNIMYGDQITTISQDTHLGLGIRIGVLSSYALLEEMIGSDSWKVVAGDPTEASLIVLGEKVGMNRQKLEDTYEFKDELPFDLDHKYHASLHRIDGLDFISVSGSPEVLLKKSTMFHSASGVQTLTEDVRGEFQKYITHYSNQGKRILALAYKEGEYHDLNHSNITGLTFYGFVAIGDSIRAEARDAVKDAQKAGIRVVMITGDHKNTARAIAQEVGIYKEGDYVITGQDLLTMDEVDLHKHLKRTSVFARVTPEQKMSIVELFKKSGEVLAMTGDGINDALSLKAAHLGVAMGNIGTDAAKSAADIVLLDDNFSTITRAILEGRNVYYTIKKTLRYLLSSNIAEVAVILGALLLFLPVPLLATQIIWLNLVTDTFLVIGLAMESQDDNLLNKKRIPKKYTLLSQKEWGIILIRACFMALITLSVFSWYQEYVSIERARTVALTMLAILQVYNIYLIRADVQSVFTFRRKNPYLLGGLIFALLLQGVVVYVPWFQNIFVTTGLLLSDWYIIVIVGFIFILLEEIVKIFVRSAQKNV